MYICNTHQHFTQTPHSNQIILTCEKKTNSYEHSPTWLIHKRCLACKACLLHQEKHNLVRTPTNFGFTLMQTFGRIYTRDAYKDSHTHIRLIQGISSTFEGRTHPYKHLPTPHSHSYEHLTHKHKHTLHILYIWKEKKPTPMNTSQYLNYTNTHDHLTYTHKTHTQKWVLHLKKLGFNYAFFAPDMIPKMSLVFENGRIVEGAHFVS